MGEWKKTGCVLCAQNCGHKKEVEKRYGTNANALARSSHRDRYIPCKEEDVK